MPFFLAQPGRGRAVVCPKAAGRACPALHGGVVFAGRDTSLFYKYFMRLPLFTTLTNSLIMVICNFMPTYVMRDTIYDYH